MTNVLLIGNINDKALDILQVNGFNVKKVPLLTNSELKMIIKDYHAIVIRSATKINKEIIDSAKNLKLIVKAGAGYDNIDCSEAEKKGIVVENCPNSIINAVVEFTVASLLI
jgi:D-3-phosphoglycerate dehydrogenase